MTSPLSPAHVRFLAKAGKAAYRVDPELRAKIVARVAAAKSGKSKGAIELARAHVAAELGVSPTSLARYLGRSGGRPIDNAVVQAALAAAEERELEKKADDDERAEH